jgi:uncharacterized protein (TIGR02594 family)
MMKRHGVLPLLGQCWSEQWIKSTRFESAKSYLNWGVQIREPAYGCVVVFSRDGGGHVGFVVGQQQNGNLMVLGGNQSDAINIRAFPSTALPVTAGL